jgi:hypothetical protein
MTPFQLSKAKITRAMSIDRKMLILQIVAAAVLVAFLGTASATRGHASDIQDSWPRTSVPLRLANPDLSYLNHKPAGLYGRVHASGADLVFEEGGNARFWGVNLQAAALFQTTPANTKAHARRLASLGFNLVRFHHHDSNWVHPNVFSAGSGTTRQLNAEALNRLDLWISALKSEGIYIWLDLHVGRQFTSKDQLWAFDEIKNSQDTADVRGFNYVSDTIQQRMLEFQEQYVTHFNPYTGLRYSEDPAILAVLITNENDVTQHFGNRLLPDKNVPAHGEKFMGLADEFAREHGLDPRAVWRSWEFGVSKLFLNDLERRFNEKMIRGLRATGFDGLVATTSTWGDNALSSLPALTSGTIIDVHSYGQPGDLSKDPLREPGFLDRVAASQVAGMPMSVSEYNISPFPADDRLVAPIRMAASAAYQGWDAPMIYGYAQAGLNPRVVPSNWDVAYDPAIIWMMPAAALMFREGHVAPARRTYALKLSSDDFFRRKVTPTESLSIRTLHEQGQLVVEIPETPELNWLTPKPAPPDAIPVTEIDTPFLPEAAEDTVSDTGEIRRDFRRGLLTVDTDRTQLAAGTLAGASIELSDMTLKSDLSTGAVIIQSLDRTPISQSRKIMITLSARAQPKEKNSTVFGIEPMQGELRVRASGNLVLTNTNGMPVTVAAAYRWDGEEHVVNLSALPGTPWLLLQSTR